MTSEIT